MKISQSVLLPLSCKLEYEEYDGGRSVCEVCVHHSSTGNLVASICFGMDEDLTLTGAELIQQNQRLHLKVSLASILKHNYVLQTWRVLKMLIIF